MNTYYYDDLFTFMLFQRDRYYFNILFNKYNVVVILLLVILNKNCFEINSQKQKATFVDSFT